MDPPRKTTDPAALPHSEAHEQFELRNKLKVRPSASGSVVRDSAEMQGSHAQPMEDDTMVVNHSIQETHENDIPESSQSDGLSNTQRPSHSQNELIWKLTGTIKSLLKEVLAGKIVITISAAHTLGITD
ncbi:hypothetical protein RND71_002100 [Anisodus tanguticus]|uniref:Uncharacterized protein n=1 Tax=Anisodus tanguticus TaxID=243964 RepID=A0AAE1T2G0_9SOLA|nr:hypothetical protein RND71_002100 [Anisodus tanguticus]